MTTITYTNPRDQIYSDVMAEFDLHADDFLRGGRAKVHDAINALCARADRLAPRVADETMRAGSTNDRPSGPRQARAWDMIYVAYVMNARTSDAAHYYPGGPGECE